MPSSWVASSRANSTLASLLSAYARSSCCQPTTGQSRRVKSRRPRRWAAEDTTTTRLGAHDFRRGSNRCVSRKGPTWFTRRSRLKASRVRPQELIPRAETRHELLFQVPHGSHGIPSCEMCLLAPGRAKLEGLPLQATSHPPCRAYSFSPALWIRMSSLGSELRKAVAKACTEARLAKSKAMKITSLFPLSCGAARARIVTRYLPSPSSQAPESLPARTKSCPSASACNGCVDSDLNLASH